MTVYFVGSRYRYVSRLDKRGRPVYEDTTVAEITDKKLILANGKSVDIEPPAQR